MAISSLLAGIGGVLYAHYILYIEPSTFSILSSLEMMIMIVVGGMGTFLGPIVGAIIMTLLPELLRFATEFRMIIYAVILLGFLLFIPKGITVYLKNRILIRRIT